MKPKVKARPTRRRNKVNRNTGKKRGRSFFIVMLFILAFALVYFFEGDRIVQQLNIARMEYVGLHPGQIMVSFLDVGQGDSILVRSNSHAVLIDGGEHSQRNTVMSYLRNAGVTRLDYVVATHPHSDHIGGLITVLRQKEIGTLLMPDVTHNTITFENFLDAIENNDIRVVFPDVGYSLQAGIIDMTVIAPPAGVTQTNLNNYSIVLRMIHGQTSFLFTGDAERELEQWMVNSGQNLNSNVLKIGHHGSRTSTTEAFLDAVNPIAAVISLGANNPFGHPHPEVIQRLQEAGIPIYRTDKLGTIRMKTDGQTIYKANN